MASHAALPAIDRQKKATLSAFFSAGFITASWAVLIPLIKSHLLIGDGTMGLLLLCLGGGALLGMPLAGITTSKYGCKPVLIVAIIGYILLYPTIPYSPSVSLLACQLVAFGMFIGVTDCAMNIQGVAVEKAVAKPIMSGFHGFYSLGGMSGAVVMTLLMSSGLSVLFAALLIITIISVLLITSYTGFRQDKPAQSDAFFALPKGTVVYIGIVCTILFLAEGTVLDWSGIFLNEYRDISKQYAGIGVASFSIAMTFGRLTGDRAISHFGARRILTAGGIIAISGFLISLVVDYWPVTILGYVLIGLGCSNIVPIMFTAAGKQETMSENMAITAVSTLGYMGVLAGPALVGFGAEITGLHVSLFCVTALVFLAMLVSVKIRV